MTALEAPPTKTNRLVLTAPLSGLVVPIETVPDPVFAQKMVGDGVSIDPTSQVLLAPCDGDIVQIHSASHAVTVKTAEGIEILMHIGLDTVALKSEGFTARVKVGDRVRSGDILIEFDADYVALHARSLLTQIVVTNSDRVAEFRPASGIVNAARDAVLELVLVGETTASEAETGPTVTSEAIVIPNPVGLHARPAAVLAQLAKKYQSAIRLHRGSDSANVRSVTTLMGLEIGRGDTVTLEATGADAEAAIAELSAALGDGLGEEGAVPVTTAAASMTQAEISAPAPRPKSDNPNIILGVAASPGVAVGNTYRQQRQALRVDETADSPQDEHRKLDRAIDQAALEIESLRAKVQGQGDPSKAAIFAAHQELLADPELMDSATSAIDQGKSAAFAWQQIYTSQADQLARLKSELLAQRANDLRDVGDRVLRILTGVQAEALVLPANTILLAEDLTPSDMANLDPARVVGFATVAGGATSHVAILARSMGIPAIAGIEPRILELADSTPVILDGTKGQVRLNASVDELEQTQGRIARQKAKQATDLEHAFTPAITQDGQQIEVVANIGSQKDAEASLKVGGEGVGLLRTEFVFMEASSAPTEDEQEVIYAGILRVLGDRPMIIRTLDVGGDKPLPYLPMAHEENPFLGERGIRLGFDRPELMRTQFRAILKASTAGKARVMFPMIARMEELDMAKAVMEEERQKLGVPPIEIGIMVEVPAAAVSAERFAEQVDFFSIGTNDLTQYTLAMDRGHPKLAPYVDALNPSVLRMIDLTVRGANKHGKWVGVCGGMAGDPQAVPILMGLGVKELSVSVPVIPAVKAQVRALSYSHCQELAQQALNLDSAAQVRDLVPLEEA
ncbi:MULTISPECIES: phosphoenolpyruvate--protein phosphotransferase [Cyanophyceae]|uniref:phosphoenolpyruvate--protein phosphotransferase n=1 Tax=Cyanophyceae TaxID=3028117 RepID=UPI001689E823|nr:MULTISPECIES: phosphoenolpyruvate--protein phosphotransferase [Cyanophyceae]MBD1917226.1 phosphoenolpyruvate--protein phosphotransferase [Phormidium sp. FACHB-77]MBD2030757.1 phosphoenolpyruvate--protein phosphotransferase [Phormidium sp. FACHB-322]MBD2050135.1 phosphoenolpyruvate--protein phosphotransferase [Leptolyngbya sp. FACHB-60]